MTDTAGQGVTPAPTTALDARAGAVRGAVKITAIKAMQVQAPGSLPRTETLIKIETDTGISGYGESSASGPLARAAIATLAGPRLPEIGLIGKDPLGRVLSCGRLAGRSAQGVRWGGADDDKALRAAG